MDSLYIEMSVISHAAARPSGDPRVAVLQQQAREWWEHERHKFQLVTSQEVLDEAGLGDPEAARRRLTLLKGGVPLVTPHPRVKTVADALVAASLLPWTARVDAAHVAAAAVAGVQYLLTQNCRHIANAYMLPRVYDLLREMGFPNLLICTPPISSEDPTMPPNPILEEIYAARRKLLEDAGGDLHRYLDEAAERARRSGRCIDLRAVEAEERRAASGGLSHGDAAADHKANDAPAAVGSLGGDAADGVHGVREFAEPAVESAHR